MTATNQILAKMLYLWLTFFQFHLCYEYQTEKNTGFPKVNLKVSDLRLETKGVRVRLLAMCRGELSAVIAWLMSKCL